MKKITNVLLWMIVIWSFLACFASGTHSGGVISAVLFLIVGICAMPIKPIRNCWEKIVPKKTKLIRIISLSIIFFVALMTVPSSGLNEDNKNFEVVTEASIDSSINESLVSDVSQSDIKNEVADTSKVPDSEPVEKEVNSEVSITGSNMDANKELASTEESAKQANSTESNQELSVIETSTLDLDNTTSVEAGNILPMEVHFLSLGQSDCTLIKCGDEAMLIDAGENDKGTTIQLYLQKQGVKKLKHFIVTHSDSDHEGSADVVIQKFDIENLFMCAFDKDTKTHKDVLNAANAKSLKWTTPTVGSVYTLGSATITVIAPNGTYTKPNDSSIAVLIKNGDNTFIFTGDCEEKAESDIIKNGIDIKADVYQVGHHGSHTASTQAFLDKVKPTYAVISCGEGNSYGHPRAETLNKFQTMGIQMFRTDVQGTIVAYSDGTNITWNMSPSDNWTPGEPTGSSVNSSTQTESSQNTSTELNQVTTTVQEEANLTEAQTGYSYTVNIKNGKIHYFGAAHGPKEENSKHFATLEEAQVYSTSIAGTADKCKTCFK